jgi:hypothetical protein
MTRRLLRSFTFTAVAAGAFVITGIHAHAQAPAGTCDYMTGAGWFNTTANQTHALGKASFVISAGCKDGSPTWGNLDYSDQGNGLQLTWMSMTAYIWAGNDASDPKTGRPHGTRIICGTATTNLFGDVDFGVVAHDASAPGLNDVFIIRLRKNGNTVYSTENPQEDFTLGSTASGGGDIQLHQPTQASVQQTPGAFGGSCPAFF